MNNSASKFWQPNYAYDMWQPNPEHFARIMEGVDAWNNWRIWHPGSIPILRGANLKAVNLKGIDLSNAEMGGSNLSGADLSQALFYQTEFFSADLRGANFSNSDLRGAKFHLADLRGADLRGSDLFRVDFISAKLDFAKLSHARCMTTAFTDVDLSEVLGLDDILHSGPSSIDVSTLLKLKTVMPKKFLNEAGVPNEIIESISKLSRSDKIYQYYSCFISYNTNDEDFAKRLYCRMRDAGLRVWFAPEHIVGGEKIHEQIDQAIKIYDKLLIVLSQHSVQSNWVMTELRKARGNEIEEDRRKIFPVRLIDYENLQKWKCFDADSGRDLASEVREYFIPDFTGWKDDSKFETAFQKLLKDLRANETERRRNL